jgi:hypothetical protein
MALDAGTKALNITKSLAQWCQETLTVQEGLPVYIEDTPDDSRPAQWVDIDVLLSLWQEFGRTVGPTHLGARSHGILNMNLCVKREPQTNIYVLSALRDKVIPYFLPSQTIPIYDYDTAGHPAVGRVLCLSWNQADVDDGQVSGVMVRNLTVALTHTEAFTLV